MAPVASRSDSVRVVHETSYVERLRVDTVAVPVPVEVYRDVVADTDTSRLSTSLAASEAWAVGGRLFHTLHNLPGQFRVPVIAKDTETRERTDSVRVVVEKQVVEVEKPPTLWSRFWTTSGKVAWGAIIAALELGAWWVVRRLKR